LSDFPSTHTEWLSHLESELILAFAERDWREVKRVYESLAIARQAFANGATSVSGDTLITKPFRDPALSSAPVAVKVGSGTIHGINLINLNTVPVYVKVFAKLLQDVVVGQTAPAHTYAVPAPGNFYIESQRQPLTILGNGIVIAAVTGLADSSSAAPTLPILVELEYV
jgi:uncharacterized integral membrane protein